jgi:hypothetical protein
MEFTLHYRGPLKAATGRNKRKDHKHDLRRHFHKQLKELWKLPQLSEFRDSLIVPEPDAVETRTLLRRVGQYNFAPLIGSYFHLVASLELVMLRAEPEGRIFVRSGDIDNRLKTLLDALKVPNDEAALPDNVSPSSAESPFFCLLEDDSLVTNVDIQTAHWLEPEVQDSDEVVLLLHIRTKPTRVTWGNMGLEGVMNSSSEAVASRHGE